MKILFIIQGLLFLCTVGVFGAGETEVSTYNNDEYGFSFEYPGDFKEVPVLYPNEIIRLAILNEFKIPVLTVSVNEKKADADLSKTTQKIVAFMQMSMPDTSQYTIMNENLIVLNDGTEAATIEFSWLLGDKVTIMETAGIIVFKDDYQITMTGNTIRGLGFPVSELSKICRTLQVSK
jgi:hypothetical protein